MDYAGYVLIVLGTLAILNNLRVRFFYTKTTGIVVGHKKDPNRKGPYDIVKFSARGKRYERTVKLGGAWMLKGEEVVIYYHSRNPDDVYTFRQSYDVIPLLLIGTGFWMLFS